MQLHLKKGEKLYLNGAVFKVDQRCSIELLNNATFLLEAHVMQPDLATTAFKQLYFSVQTMLMDPMNAAMTRELYWHQSSCLHATLEDEVLLSGLVSSDDCIKNQRYFDALKIIRSLFSHEKTILEHHCLREIA